MILRELLPPELHHLKTLLLVPYNSNPSSYNRIGGQNCTKTSWLVYLMVFTVPQHQLKIEEPIFHWWDALEVPLLVFSLGAKSHIRSFYPSTANMTFDINKERRVTLQLVLSMQNAFLDVHPKGLVTVNVLNFKNDWIQSEIQKVLNYLRGGKAK